MDRSTMSGHAGAALNISHCTTRAQLEAVVDLCDRAFPDTSRDYFERHILRDATLRPEETLIGTVGETIVSSVQIFPRRCWIQGAIVPFAGIGNVATDPGKRGAGYAGALMEEALRRMRGGGFAFSLLTTTSVTSYYEKFGYRVLPRTAVIFAPPASVPTGFTIRRFDPAVDWLRVRELYEAYNRESAGPVARDELYWNAQWEFCGEERAMFLIAERGGSPVGYLRAGMKKGVLRILEFAARVNIPSVFGALLEALGRMRPGATFKAIFSDREMRRLAPLPAHDLQPDTDAMMLVLDENRRELIEGELMRPGSFMFWLADSF